MQKISPFLPFFKSTEHNFPVLNYKNRLNFTSLQKSYII